MRVVQYRSGGGAEGLYFEELPDPVPSEEEILVEVAATALNRADLLQRGGHYPPPEGASEILGLEMSGTVVQVGRKVTKWKPGDRVCGLLAGGAYATLVVIDQSLALPLPDGMSFEQAAAIPEVFLTAFQALRLLAKLQAGERLLFHAGASGVGTAAIQLAKAMDGEIFVTASSPKHELCFRLGASHAIDYREHDFEKVILDLTDGEGVDVIVDPIGAPYFQQNLRLLRIDGRLVYLAMMGGARLKDASLGPILGKRLKIKGTTLRSRSLEYKTSLIASFKAFAWEGFQAGLFKPVIDSIFPWEQVAEAHNRMEENLNAGKIVLKVNS